MMVGGSSSNLFKLLLRFFRRLGTVVADVGWGGVSLKQETSFDCSMNSICIAGYSYECHGLKPGQGEG